jgi:hypothetical protein
LAFTAIEVMRLTGSPIAQWLEVLLLDHQGLTMPVKEEPYFGCSGRVIQQEGIGDDFVEVEELDGLQGPPDFLPASRKVRPI